MRKHKRLIAILMALSILFSFTAFAADEASSDEPKEEYVLSEKTLERIYDPANYESGEYVPGEVLVGFKNIYPEDQSFEELLPDLDIVEVNVIPSKSNTVIKIKLCEETHESVINAIDVLKENELIAYAEPDYYFELMDYNFTNIDPFYEDGTQWNLYAIDAEDAWALDAETPSSNVAVGVIDTGIYDHDDFDGNLRSGYNMVTPGAITNTDDNVGHGTHVAGIIGAAGDNGYGIAGVCWRAKLVPYKVMETGVAGAETTCSYIAFAIYLATEDNVPILNISLGTTFYSQTLRDKIVTYPGLIVTSAGNTLSGGIDLDLDGNVNYPGSFLVVDNDNSEEGIIDNIIIVGNLSETEGLSLDEYAVCPTSNYGSESVNLFAPGTDILSTYNDANTFAFDTGTSMAAPHVAGVAALVLSNHPTFSYARIKSVIRWSVKEIGGLEDYCITGGIVNAKNALEVADLTLGDINNDGEISNIDTILIARYVVNLITLSNYQLYTADVNLDGVIDNADLILISQMVVA